MFKLLKLIIYILLGLGLRSKCFSVLAYNRDQDDWYLFEDTTTIRPLVHYYPKNDEVYIFDDTTTIRPLIHEYPQNDDLYLFDDTTTIRPLVHEYPQNDDLFLFDDTTTIRPLIHEYPKNDEVYQFVEDTTTMQPDLGSNLETDDTEITEKHTTLDSTTTKSILENVSLIVEPVSVIEKIVISTIEQKPTTISTTTAKQLRGQTTEAEADVETTESTMEEKTTKKSTTPIAISITDKIVTIKQKPTTISTTTAKKNRGRRIPEYPFKENDFLELKCGNRTLELNEQIKWEKINGVFPSSSRTRGNKILLIRLKNEDKGVYKCTRKSNETFKFHLILESDSKIRKITKSVASESTISPQPNTESQKVKPCCQRSSGRHYLGLCNPVNCFF